MPNYIAALIQKVLKPDGQLVIASCYSGVDVPEVQLLDTRLQRKVTASKGWTYGVSIPYETGGFGGYCDNGYYTKPPGSPP
jgi:hypothetical protein